jgi:hypothetical protein
MAAFSSPNQNYGRYGSWEDPCPPKEYKIGKTSYGMLPQVRGQSGAHFGQCVFSAANKKAAQQAARNARIANPRLRKNGMPVAANAFGPKRQRKPKIIKTHAQIKAHTLKTGPCPPGRNGEERTRVQGGPSAGRCVMVKHLSKHLGKAGICEPKRAPSGRMVQYVANPQYGQERGARACIKAGGAATKAKIIQSFLFAEGMTKSKLYADPKAKATFFKKHEDKLCNPNQYFKVKTPAKKLSIGGKSGWDVGRCVALKGADRKCPMGEMLYTKKTNKVGEKSGLPVFTQKCYPTDGSKKIPQGFTAIFGSEGTHPGYNAYTVEAARAAKTARQGGVACPTKQRVIKGAPSGPAVQQVRSASGRCVFPNSKAAGGLPPLARAHAAKGAKKAAGGKKAGAKKAAGPRRVPVGSAKNYIGQSLTGSNGFMYTPKQVKGGSYRWTKAS